MTSPAPVSIDEVMNPDWIGTAIGACVESVREVETIKTVATKIRVEVDVAGEPAPRHLCIKGLFDGVAPASGLARMSRSETLFYRDLQSGVAVNTPRCRYAAIDEITGNGVIVMDDVVAAGGRFLTALEPYTPDQAAASLDQIAILHARHWGSEGLESHTWLKSNLHEFAARPLRSDEELQLLLDDGRAEHLPSALRDAGRVTRGLQALSETSRSAVTTLVHGDAHAGNLFVLEGRTSLIDWQVLQRSSWGIDVAYHIGAVLTVEDRRASERDLLDHYLDALASRGVDAPDRSTAWQLYRVSVAYGFYMWAITRRVEKAIIHEFVKRLGNAVIDLHAFELLEV